MNVSSRDSLFREIGSLREYLGRTRSLKNCTVQQVDFTTHRINWEDTVVENAVFLGCSFLRAEKSYLLEQGAIIFPKVNHLPYEPYRSSLYTWQELMAGYHPETDESPDYLIYRYFSQFKVNPPITEALYQRIHDHAIDDALRDFLDFQPSGLTQKRCVGIMGGHNTLRTDRFFHLVARTAKQLAEQGYTIVSGGGPGIMEAANLGAYFAFQSEVDLREAITLLEAAPHYSDASYVTQARKVIEKFPAGHTSLAIPTWFYGHEPSNLFASHIAKYFSNSIREDTLLAICLHGVIFAPGSAGTIQEIFMDAAQNHYGSFNYVSPMIFLGKKWYEIESMIFPLVKKLSYGKRYHDLLFISDDPKRIVQFIVNHKPEPNTKS